MNISYDEKDVVNRECRFATHIPRNRGNPNDVHLIKEQLTLKDGSLVPNIKLIKDFNRPFWITRKEKRNYQDTLIIIEKNIKRIFY